MSRRFTLTLGDKHDAVALVLRNSTGRVKVLAYHAIADLRDDPIVAEYSVSPTRFAEQLDTLLRRGWEFVDLDAVLDALRGDRRMPRRAVLLTFDDAYADLLETACPILAERGIPAVVFAVAEQVGGTNSWDRELGAARLDLLDAVGLRKVAARGIEVGAHSSNHPSLPDVPRDRLDHELAGAADRLSALGLPRPRAFCYPYGHWNAQLARAVREAGYEVAFTVEWGVVRDGVDTFALPRVEVHAGDTGRKLRLKLSLAGWPGFARVVLRRLLH